VTGWKDSHFLNPDEQQFKESLEHTKESMGIIVKENRKIVKKKDAEIERMKGLIKELYYSTGNKIAANIFDIDMDNHWQQFKSENNLKSPHQ
jgi:hypothetical protein